MATVSLITCYHAIFYLFISPPSKTAFRSERSGLNAWPTIALNASSVDISGSLEFCNALQR